ncbi:MAG: hypothetical protein ACFFC3_09520 [Candidatus Odinarchaeota archaeon]
MDKQRILREAQKIAAKFPFWMVSGNISHLYGHVHEIPEKKYELEIKFDETFPNAPPKFIYRDEIKRLLGDFQLKKISNWTPESSVVDIIQELKNKIQEALQKPRNEIFSQEAEEYITPDLNVYPPDSELGEFMTPSFSDNDFFYDKQPDLSNQESFDNNSSKNSEFESETLTLGNKIEEPEHMSIILNTEIGLIQQEYAYDQKSSKGADILVYITITLTNTFIISIDFTNYPKKPLVSFPEDVQNLLGDPYIALDTLKSWNPKTPLHIIDILHELEKKLYFIKDIDTQSKKISGEYRSEKVSDNLTLIEVHLLTYGFNEYLLNVDLSPYPKPPQINPSPELQQIINVPITELDAYKNWIEKESEPVEIIREISWLLDKNSRINFEIDLLKDHYKDIKYNSTTATLNVDMKGKMKTQDIIFKFEIILPVEYPMKIPEIKVINEFELESHEKIKNDLHSSFDDFFNQWTPFSYLVDLFNLISKKIFEVSVVSCVICHKIECPICSKKIAGEDNCHAECPHCNRAYHNHCWEQTIKSFGKCGFCLR